MNPLNLLSAGSSGGRISQAVQLASLSVAAYQQATALYHQWNAKQRYIIRMDSEDDNYQAVHTWLLSQIPQTEWRSLEAITPYRNRRHSDDDGEDESKPLIEYRYDGNRTLKVKLDGCPVLVEIERNSVEEGKVTKLTESIVFVTDSPRGRGQIMAKLLEIAEREAAQEAPSRIFIATQYGGWQATRSISTRDPKTVILADGQMERISADLAQFLTSESLYARIGTPWHRGYLFHGPAGTGKTSAARALAFAHQLDVYYLPLSDVKSDVNLIAMISMIRDRSILLIEDIDITSAATDREDQDNKLSMQGLLNALDGAVTPHGLITIMTTNDIDALDPAIRRKGRCDLVEEMTYLDDGQLSRLVEVLTGRSMPEVQLGAVRISAADVAEVVKANITDMEKAREEIFRFVFEQTARDCSA